MKKEPKKPRVLPQPLPLKPELVDPIIAAGDMFCPGSKGVVSDPDGSYTGRPVDGGQPIQDADDL